MTTTERVLAYVRQYRGEQGYSPTLVEIAAAVGLASKSGAAYHVRQLERAGQITRTFKTPRGVRVR